MVLTFLVGFGAVFGASEGIRASQSKARREEHRTRKNNLLVHCSKSSQFSSILEGRRVVLSGDKVRTFFQISSLECLLTAKLYVDTGRDHGVPFGHPFAGYYLPYPESSFSGLVSTITDEAPIMNWVFVHRETYELKFGTRQYSEGNLTGPFDCTRQDRRLTFGGWEGFVAVQEGDVWALYFDRDNDKLRSKVQPGTPVIEVDLLRREMRTKRPEPPPEPKSDQKANEHKQNASEKDTNQRRDPTTSQKPREEELPMAPEVD